MIKAQNRVSHFIFMFWRKFKPYGLVFTFLCAVIFLAWFLFICRKVVDDIALQITGILSVLGLGFALLQFWFNHITTEKRRTFDLRYEAFKDIVKQVETVAETVSSALTTKYINEVKGFLSVLRIQILKLKSNIGVNDSYLFPMILESEESIVMQELMKKLMIRTDEYIRTIDNIPPSTGVNPKINSESEKWQKEMAECLGEWHENKYKFYKKLREYFN